MLTEAREPEARTSVQSRAWSSSAQKHNRVEGKGKDKTGTAQQGTAKGHAGAGGLA